MFVGASDQPLAVNASVLQLDIGDGPAFAGGPNEGEGHFLRHVKGVNKNLFLGLQVGGMRDYVGGKPFETRIHDNKWGREIKLPGESSNRGS